MSQPSTFPDDEELDVAIVGAGAAGTVMDLAAHPDPSLPIHLCGEVFSRRGAWVEGALETAEGVAARLLTVQILSQPTG